MSRPGRPTSVARWSLQDAKNKLSAVVDAAAKGSPQIVTRRGVETAVIISYDEYERMTSAGRRPPMSFTAYLLAIPAAAKEDADIERIELPARNADL